ncbi:TPA: fimbrial protein [Pseudomonas aeruginosa]|uniref:fimbrial protein n=1 Tax=Pseudomonas aeruginosa TaxID=287 RepID=UPI000339D379|nr:fimbrial protein [Pseudomonas aeruginosa]EIX9395340.1 fimbrial protein [Pseudomonas aeruginosa]EKQ6385736.1 fimbrial protein [Pseudomonas aeruginosa]ELN2598701.1 fimbrial protein [Pseudomonas aeruginosa]EOT07402.1 hypothetical protein L346_05653 [Pseudomonas aeruginosa MSH-10]ERX75874.1 hypothetical protein P999_00207 [Pseudomonas aeruginosa MSH3]
MIYKLSGTTPTSQCAALIYALFLATFSNSAWAVCQWVQSSSAPVLSAPASLTVLPDQPTLTPISNWIEGSYPSLWKCSSSLDATKVRAAFLTQSSPTGQDYDGLTIYKTSTPGVGYIAKMRTTSNRTSASNFVNVQNISLGRDSDSPATLGAEIMVQLIKIGPILPGSRLNSTAVAKATSYVYNIFGTPVPDLSANIFLPSINFLVPTCQTRDVNVNLGDIYLGKFQGVGSEAGKQDFDIRLENCPGGFSKILYRLDPINETIDSDKGIIQIDKGSDAAAGIAVRIVSRDSKLKLGTQQQIPSYVGEKGTYSIPFTASYYQTGAITPGTANASLEFTIEYQ